MFIRRLKQRPDASVSTLVLFSALSGLINIRPDFELCPLNFNLLKLSLYTNVHPYVRNHRN